MANVIEFNGLNKMVRAEQDLFDAIMNVIYDHSEKNGVTVYQVYGCLDDIKNTISSEE